MARGNKLENDEWGDSTAVVLGTRAPAAVVDFAMRRSSQREVAAVMAKKQEQDRTWAEWVAKIDASLGDTRGAGYYAAVAALQVAESEFATITGAWQEAREDLQKKQQAVAIQIEGADIADLKKLARQARSQQSEQRAEMEMLTAIVAELDRRRHEAQQRSAAAAAAVAHESTRALHSLANETAVKVAQSLAAVLLEYDELARIETLITERGGLRISRLDGNTFSRMRIMVEKVQENRVTWPEREGR